MIEPLISPAHIAEHFNQIVEAPQVDACLRLVKNAQLSLARHHGGNLDSFDLAAGKACVDLAVDIILCTQSPPA